jgi:pimeloyl-ACP methyl ester carboxylesterase
MHGKQRRVAQPGSLTDASPARGRVSARASACAGARPLGASRADETPQTARAAMRARHPVRGDMALACAPAGQLAGRKPKGGPRMTARSAIGGLAVVFLLSAGSAAHAQARRPLGETGGVSSPLHEPTACGRGFTEHGVQRGPHSIYVREYAGAEPAIVLMHGLPDHLTLYDRLVPHLCGRRLVLFDFLGWGRSDKPEEEDYAYTFANQKGELEEVITQRGLVRPVLVAHDGSGPAAINWALDHPSALGGLVLLNTFYHLTPFNSAPEAIAIFADLLELRTAPLVPPAVPWSFERLSQAIAADSQMFRWLYYWQVGRFFRDDPVRRVFVPKLYAEFARPPSSIPAFVALNRDLRAAVGANTRRVPELAAFDRPVRIIFGDSDPYLTADLARAFHASFPTSDLFLLPSARHYVQMDEPEEVARLILEAPVQ